MKMKGTFLFLGTSASAGVPEIGCSCDVCTSSSPFDQRLRPSGLLQLQGKTILIDVGPDFRQQALKYKINHLDGMLLTHTHFDHIAGIDELRIYYLKEKKALPCLLSKESHEDLLKRYDYIFRPPSSGTSLSAQIACQVLHGDEGKTDFLGIPIEYMSYAQIGMKVNGFRIGKLAYISDISKYKETIFASLEGVETLILSALRAKPSSFHFSFEEAVQFSRRIGAKQTWLTHLGHSTSQAQANELLPEQVRVAYDGLQLEFYYDS